MSNFKKYIKAVMPNKSTTNTIAILEKYFIFIAVTSLALEFSIDSFRIPLDSGDTILT